MTHSTNERKLIYEAYVTVVATEDFGRPTAKRMTITVYRGRSRQRAVMAYNDLSQPPVVNCHVVEHGWRVVE